MANIDKSGKDWHCASPARNLVELWRSPDVVESYHTSTISSKAPKAPVGVFLSSTVKQTVLMVVSIGDKARLARTLDREQLLQRCAPLIGTIAAGTTFKAVCGTQTRHGGSVNKEQPCSQVIWQKPGIGPMAVCKSSPLKGKAERKGNLTRGSTQEASEPCLPRGRAIDMGNENG